MDNIGKLSYDPTTGQPRLQRGKLNEGDKHWGMRSNKKFWKKLEVK